MKLLLLSGSFHSNSKSLTILQALQDYFPDHEYRLPELNRIPFYCEDLALNKPETVQEISASTEWADAIVICSPEYNHSIPAVLKNAIDWASRPAFQSPLKDKPVTIITQANSPVGGARAQAHIKLIFDSALSIIYPSHEMMITGINSVIDAEGNLIDSQVEERLKRHIKGFLEFVSQ